MYLYLKGNKFINNHHHHHERGSRSISYKPFQAKLSCMTNDTNNYYLFKKKTQNCIGMYVRSISNTKTKYVYVGLFGIFCLETHMFFSFCFVLVDVEAHRII